jgi:hypothetical protein
MKFKLDKYGQLCVTKNGKQYFQLCPFAHSFSNEKTLCGQWCPHFGEISNEVEYSSSFSMIQTICTTLKLCHGTKLEMRSNNTEEDNYEYATKELEGNENE